MASLPSPPVPPASSDWSNRCREEGDRHGLSVVRVGSRPLHQARRGPGRAEHPPLALFGSHSSFGARLGPSDDAAEPIAPEGQLSGSGRDLRNGRPLGPRMRAGATRVCQALLAYVPLIASSSRVAARMLLCPPAPMRPFSVWSIRPSRTATARSCSRKMFRHLNIQVRNRKTTGASDSSPRDVGSDSPLSRATWRGLSRACEDKRDGDQLLRPPS
jgi:hypothetical protein